jgi:hypothetical protein
MTEEKVSDEIKFHYLKSNVFRVIHADGAVGAVSPSLDIHMSLFSERSPIPNLMVVKLAPDGTLGSEMKDRRIARDGYVREVEIDVVMTYPVAKSIVTFLQEHIKTVEAGIEAARKSETDAEPADSVSE